MSTTVQSPVITNAPFHTRPPGRPIAWSVGDGATSEIVVHAEGAQTGLRCTVAEHRWPAGSEGGLHAHLLEDEGFYVLEGEVTFLMPDDDLELTARAGEFVWHPNRRRHGYRVASDGDARVLQFLLPGTKLVPDFFARLEERGVASGDLAELIRSARAEFGIVFDVPDTPGLAARTASARGPATGDAGVIAPPAATTVSNRPFKSDPANARGLRIGRGMMTKVSCVFHAFGYQTGNVFGLTEIEWGPGDVAGPHIHTLEDEGFYLLSGELTLHVASPDGVVDAVAREGDFVWAPRDMPHYYEVTGDAGARVLVFAVPGNTLMDFFYGVTEGHGADIESDEKLDEFVRWSADNFGIHFMAPDEFPEH